jgi:drug/metabolite transporter (DMT)-like permease
MTSPTITPAAAAMMLALALLWGGSFFFAAVALTEVPPMTIALFRVGLALPMMLVIVRLRGVAISRALRVWAAWLVMGALNNAIPFSLIFWGQTRIDSGLAAILNGTTAVFAAVVAAIFLRDEPLTARKLGGASLGLAGVAVIIGPDLLRGLDLTDLAQLAVLGAALSYAFAGVWARRTLADQPADANAFGMLAGSTVLMIPLVLMVDGVPALDLAAPVWAALLALAFLSTALAYMLYFGILVRAGAANLLLVTLLIPPIAVILGAVFLNERLSPGALYGFVLIATGLLVTDGRLAARLRRLRRV